MSRHVNLNYNYYNYFPFISKYMGPNKWYSKAWRTVFPIHFSGWASTANMLNFLQYRMIYYVSVYLQDLLLMGV